MLAIAQRSIMVLLQGGGDAAHRRVRWAELQATLPRVTLRSARSARHCNPDTDCGCGRHAGAHRKHRRPATRSISIQWRLCDGAERVYGDRCGRAGGCDDRAPMKAARSPVDCRVVVVSSSAENQTSLDRIDWHFGYSALSLSQNNPFVGRHLVELGRRLRRPS